MMLTALFVALLAHQAAAQATPASTVRVCVGNGKTSEATACSAWLRKALPANTTAAVNFECVYETSEDLCLQRIRSGGADLVRGGGNLIFQGGREYGMMVYATEDYGDAAGASYWAVAVVRKSFCDARRNDVTLRDLKGTRSCHTGYRRTAGWTLPVGYLVSRNIMPVISEDNEVQDDAESVASFFEDVCAPGTTNGEGAGAGPATDGSRTGKPWGAMCSICNKGKQSCDAQSGYIDYGGALRCMVENSGEVAWVKHTTPTDFSTTGTSRQPWSVSTDELRVVCGDGSGCRPISDAARCGYARAPAHAFIGKAAAPQLEEAARLLATASALPGWTTEGIAFGVLSADAKSVKIVGVTGRPIPAQDLMDTATYDSFEAVRLLREPPQPSTGGSDGLSPGAIAGIVIGAVVGTALLAAVIAVFVIRYNKKKSWEEFCRQHDSSGAKPMAGV